MGINIIKVQLLAVVAGACVISWCGASLCESGLEYWSEELESCVTCSKCDSGAKHVVIRPCQAHTDTVCGPISDLDIDWSWLKHRRYNKHHDKNLAPTEKSERNHHQKVNKHHVALDDDIEMKPYQLNDMDEEVEATTNKHHKGHKHHKKLNDENDLRFEKKTNKHHLSSKRLFGFDDLDSFHHRNTKKTTISSPIKSSEDLEKEWKEWLIQSKNRLQHRKDDLLKNLHKESPYNEKYSRHKLNQPTGNVFDDFDGEIFHHSAHHKDHSEDKQFSPLDVEIFDKLLNHEHQKRERLSLSHFLNKEGKHGDLLDILKSDSKEKKSEESYPVDPLDFHSVVPTHRLILGEPSTVSEMLDQDMSEVAEDERVQDIDSGVIAVPFTAAERFVWDWQAVALASAVAACMLFFSVVAVYSILHSRQWRRLKTNVDNDAEEMSVKMTLIHNHNNTVGASAADAVNTNLYLDNLLGNKKTGSNLYTPKQSVS